MLRISYTIKKDENLSKYQEEPNIVKEYHGTRDFIGDNEANKFLERLAMFKMKLAFRCAGEKFTKMSDGFKKNSNPMSYGHAFGSYDYKRSAQQAYSKNVYRMSVNIEHLKQAA